MATVFVVDIGLSPRVQAGPGDSSLVNEASLSQIHDAARMIAGKPMMINVNQYPFFAGLSLTNAGGEMII